MAQTGEFVRLSPYNNTMPRSYENKAALATIDKANRTLARAELLGQLSAILKPLWPHPLQAHCQLLNVRGSVMIIGLDNAMWLQQAKAFVPELSKQLKHIPELRKVEHIQFKINPQVAAKDNPANNRHISEANKQAITSTAAHIKNEKLRAALEKLGK